MTNDEDGMQSMIESVISNWKVPAGVAAGNASLGAAARMELIQGWLAIASMSVGIVTGLLIAGWWAIRVEKAWRNRHNMKD